MVNAKGHFMAYWRENCLYALLAMDLGAVSLQNVCHATALGKNSLAINYDSQGIKPTKTLNKAVLSPTAGMDSLSLRRPKPWR